MEKAKINRKLLWIIVPVAVLAIAAAVTLLLLLPSGNITIAIQPQKITLETGQSQQLQIVSEKGSISQNTVVWSSLSDVVASVDENGLVTAKEPGNTRIVATVSAKGKEAVAYADITVTAVSIDKIQVGGDEVKDDIEIKGEKFTVLSASDGVAYDMDKGIIEISDAVKQTEIIFAQSMNDPYAAQWDLRGSIERTSIDQSLFLSFGVKDESGKEQWFCVFEDALSLQRYWNWADTRYELDGVHVGYNDAASEFFWRRADRLDYIAVLQDDVLKVYFGSDQYDMALAWSLPLTDSRFGGFEAGAEYVLGINTVDPCNLAITDISTKNGDDVEDLGGSISMKNVDVHITGDRFRVDSASKGISTNASKGTITINKRADQSELIFAASRTQKYADAWEMTGRIKKGDIQANLFLSFGVKDSAGKEQWFCLLGDSSVSLQRYWNWWDSEYFADGVYVLKNAAAEQFYDKDTDYIDYRLIVANDVLKMYFGNDEQELTLAWAIPLTDIEFGGFKAGSKYQLGINTVDPNDLYFTDVTVRCGSDVENDPSDDPEVIDGEPTFYVASVTEGVKTYPNKSKITYSAQDKTELFFAASENGGYARDWEVSGELVRWSNWPESLLSFGVRDANGKTQWFSIKEHMASLDNTGANTLYDGTYVRYNDAATLFYWRTLEDGGLTLNYKITVKDDVLIAWFGSTTREMGQAWYFPLTDAQFGGFAAGSEYQVGIHTVDNCAMTVSNAEATALDAKYDDYKFFVERESDGVTSKPLQGTISTRNSVSQTELMFAANREHNFAKYWEVTGSIKKENVQDNLFLSFGVQGYSGTGQWFCILQNGLSRQRYWNWWDTEYKYDGNYVIENAAARSFYDKETDTLHYKLVLQNDVLKVYFGSTTDNLVLAWNLPLTEELWGGFAPGTAYQIGINTVDPCALQISNVTVKTADSVAGGYGVEYDPFNYRSNEAKQKAKLEAGYKEGITTVFIGDSFFDQDGFRNFVDLYGTKEALCLGIGGTSTNHWVTFMNDWLNGYQFKNIVVNIGTNNMGRGDFTDDVIEDLKEMFLRLKREFPDSNIYWFSIALRSDMSREEAKAIINAEMKKWCGENGIIYVENTIVDPDTDCSDGLHPNMASYEKYAEALADAGCVMADRDMSKARFYVASETGHWLDYDEEAGKIWYSDTDNTELFFSAGDNGSYADSWELTGSITRSFKEGMLLSFGVKDATGKIQWFSIKEHAAGLDNEGNNPVYDDAHAWWNEPSCNFYWNNASVLSYKITVVDDVLCAYFGTSPDNLQQAWYFPLTDNRFGGFAEGSQYQLGIFTRGTCDMQMSDVSVVTGDAVEGEVVDASRYDVSQYAQKVVNRKQRLQADAKDGVTTVFIGDSFFDEAELFKNFFNIYHGKEALCLGISGSTTQHWVTFTNDWLDDYSPKNIVVNIGTNNLGYGDKTGYVLSGLQELLTLLKEKFPDSSIYWFSIAPRSDIDREAIRLAVNEAMKQWCGENGIIYVENTVADPAADCFDGLHPTLDEYWEYATALEEAGCVIADKAQGDNRFYISGATEGIFYSAATGEIGMDGAKETTELFFGADENGGYANDWELTGTVNRTWTESMILSFGVKDATGKTQWFSIKEHAAGLDNEGNNTVYDDVHAWWNQPACSFYWNYPDYMTISYKITVEDDVLRAYFGTDSNNLQQAWYFPLTDARFGGFADGTQYQLGIFTRKACAMSMTDVTVTATAHNIDPADSKFYVGSISGGVTAKPSYGKLVYDGTQNTTELFFAADENGSYAEQWELTGTVTRENVEGMLLSFGVKDNNGRTQWFSIKEHAAGLDNEGNDPIYDDVHAWWNYSSCAFYWRYADSMTISYKITVKDDVLCAYFGPDADSLAQAWYFPLTDSRFGGFATGTEYQLGIFTRVACKMEMTDVAVTASNDEKVTKQNWQDDGALKILAIGNSFSEDALTYVYQIAADLGVQEIKLGNLFIGGCSLATHDSNITNNNAAYTYFVCDNGNWTSYQNHTIQAALESDNWDFITFQQASGDSGMSNTYRILSELVGKVEKYCPAANFAWHMTWAYQGDSDHVDFGKYGSNQNTMYQAIVSAVQDMVVTNGDIGILIPSGTAIQNARTSYLGDTLTRDGYHLSLDVGRYIAGLCYVKALTGLELTGSFRPSGLDDGECQIALEAVNNAFVKPYEVTRSQYGEEPDGENKFCISSISGGVTARPVSGTITYDGTQNTTELFFGADENGSYSSDWELTGTVTRENVEGMLLSFGVKDKTGKTQWFSIKEHAAGLDNEGNNPIYDDVHAWWNYSSCAFYWRYADSMTISYKITVKDDVLCAYFGPSADSVAQAWYFPLTDAQFGGFAAGTEYQLGIFTRVACKMEMTDVAVFAGQAVPIQKFCIAKATNTTYDANVGTLTTDGTNNTETYFAANASGGYSAKWEMTGKITKDNAADNLFFSFGVRDSSGKDQWFCMLENGLSRQRYWNWWDTEYEFDGVYAIENAAAKTFYQHNSNTLYYKLVIENDVLKVYFGDSMESLSLSWNLPLTQSLWGGFSSGTQYQVGINTVDPCKLTISQLEVKTEGNS